MHSNMHFQIQLKISCIHQAKRKKETKLNAFLYAFFKKNIIKNSYSNKFHAF